MLIRKILALILWVPTVILWILFCPMFKLLSWLNGGGMAWIWLKVHVVD